MKQGVLKRVCVSKDLSTHHDRCNLETNNAFLYLCGGKGFFNFPNGIPVSTTPLVAACHVNSVIRPDTHTAQALPQKCVKITMITHVDIRYGWRRHSGCQSIVTQELPEMALISMLPAMF